MGLGHDLGLCPHHPATRPAHPPLTYIPFLLHNATCTPTSMVVYSPLAVVRAVLGEFCRTQRRIVSAALAPGHRRSVRASVLRVRRVLSIRTGAVRVVDFGGGGPAPRHIDTMGFRVAGAGVDIAPGTAAPPVVIVEVVARPEGVAGTQRAA